MAFQHQAGTAMECLSVCWISELVSVLLLSEAYIAFCRFQSPYTRKRLQTMKVEKYIVVGLK